MKTRAIRPDEVCPPGAPVPGTAALVRRLNAHIRESAPAADGGWYFSTEGASPAQVAALVREFSSAGWDARTCADRDGRYVWVGRRPGGAP